MNLSWNNLLAWSIQATIVAAAGSCLPWLFRLQQSRARLWYWRILLLTCIALPLIQPWITPPPVSSDIAFTTGAFHLAATSEPSKFSVSWTALGLVVLFGGIALRMLWLAAGLLRLRHYRAASRILEPLEVQLAQMRRAIAPRAAIQLSRSVSSPVTFGLRKPVILLPETFRDLAADARLSIVCHELIHIRRRDWPAAILEEVLRSILWFHPAIWWLLGQIQLTREQVVDESVIEITGDPHRYLDALLSIASLRLRADLAPAPLFLKKRHLRQRVESIVSGVNMTKRNLLLPLAATLASLPVVIGIAVWQFPLRAAPQEAADDSGIEIQLGAAKVLHRTGIVFPDEARARHLSGTVIASVTVNDKGEVTDAVAISGPSEFRKPVIQSLLNWHFSPDSVASASNLQIAVRFDGGQTPPVAVARETFMAMPSPAQDTPLTIEAVNVDSLPAALRDKVSQANVVRAGDVLTRESFKTVEASLRQIDDHLRMMGALHGDKMSVIIRLAPPPTPRTPGTAFQASGDGPRLRVGGAVQAANLVQQVRPVYPPLAKQARIQGTVRFDVIIATDGSIKNLTVVSGHPLLIQSALEAVKQWIYKPTLLNGNAVEIATTVDVNFTLNDIPANTVVQ